MDLTERARRYVAELPPAVAGSNGHNATFHVACVLVQGFGFSPEQAAPLLDEYNATCAPPWSQKELQHKLSQADKASSKRGRGWLAKGAEWEPSADWRGTHTLPAKPKPVFAAEKLAKFSGDWAKRVDLVWLANRSALDPASVGRGLFLKTLYGEGEKVAVFTYEYATEAGRGLTLWPDGEPPECGDEPRPCGVWFLNQPVDGKYHPHDDPTKPASCRSWRAVTSWRFMVIESDTADTRQWLGALAQLPLRIAAIYTSGGRSVHALVRIDAPTKSAWDAERDKMREALVVLGADNNTLSAGAVRLTRLPGCWRHGKMVDGPPDAAGKCKKLYERFPRPKLQKLLYINPHAPLAPLIDVFARRDVVKHWTELASVGIADNDETGGAWIERGLDYYAGVSSECLVALEEMRGSK